MEGGETEFNTPPREAEQEKPTVTPEIFAAELTDPKHHNPERFCYLVHGLNPGAKDQLLMLALRQGRYDASQEVDLLRDPEKIVDKKLISTSIINQDHMKTWGSVFFILDAPWNNYVSMSPRDSATNITNPDFVLDYSQPPYALPSQLVEQSQGGLNEVVVTGTKGTEQVKIIGIGIKLTDVGEEKNHEPGEAEQMRAIAERLGVPLIEFVEKVRIEDSPPEINMGYGGHVRSLLINKNGYRYIFEAEWDNPELKECFRGNKNFYGGYNPITREEWALRRPIIAEKMDTPAKLDFLRQIDEHFGF